MQMLAGQPQIVFFSGILIGWTLLFRMAGRRADLRTDRAGALAVLLAGPALAVGLSAVHWWPAYELQMFSIRRMMGIAYATTYALPWSNFITLLSPGALGAPGTGGYRGAWNFTETAIFVGQAALGLAAIGWIARRGDRRTWLTVAVGASGCVLALGAATPVHDLLLRLLPTLEGFRAPARAWCLTTLALAVAGGRGLDAVAGWAGRRRGVAWRRAAIAVLLALQLAGLGWYRFHLFALPMTDRAPLATPGIEQIIRAATDRPGRLFRLVNEIDYNDASEAATRAKVAAAQPDLNALVGLRDAMGYDEGLLPLATHLGLIWHFWSNLYTPQPDSRLLGLMGVEFLLADKPIFGERWERVGSHGKVAVWRNLDYRGEVFTDAHWPDVDIGVVSGPFLSPEASARPIDLTPRGLREGAPPPPPIRYERPAPGNIDVHLPPDWSGRLLLSEGAMPDWFAEGGGRVIRGRFVNATLMAFDLPAGVGEWTLRYDPLGFRRGAMLSALASAALLGLGLWRRRLTTHPLRPDTGDRPSAAAPTESESTP
jgi:hypothetical protein